MAVSANSPGCQFCGTKFPGFGKTRQAAEADAYSNQVNHEMSCTKNPANQK